ncbi:MAG: phosphoribosylaminoimidazolecarboxamide formyltransferase [Eubacteriales bacterium]|nr:phosphoribosylaminoimidazolecarboxamide formyltransferase [Eubacteriales bacterium]
MDLKYGCNPHQKPASVSVKTGSLPITVLNGAPGYINLLDALNAWQLVRELRQATGLPAAASFKHVSPAGAAVGLPLSEPLRRMYYVTEEELSPLACAYVRARGADRLSSFGDFIALSDVCDASTARVILPEVSDGVIAPEYDADALALLKQKRKGGYTILQMDASYTPPEMEQREVYGVTFTQRRNDTPITAAHLSHIVTEQTSLSDSAVRDLLIALITVKYTQSNSVCYAKDGQTIGVGAGQQSRIHCTRLAGSKADLWHLRQHPVVLSLPFLETLKRPERDNAIDLYLSEEDSADVLSEENWPHYFKTKPEPLSKEEKQRFLSGCSGVSLASDAFFPFSDNILRACRSGVQYIAQPGGSIRDDLVIDACNQKGVVMCFTGLRLFHH